MEVSVFIQEKVAETILERQGPEQSWFLIEPAKGIEKDVVADSGSLRLGVRFVALYRAWTENREDYCTRREGQRRRIEHDQTKWKVECQLNIRTKDS